MQPQVSGGTPSQEIISSLQDSALKFITIAKSNIYWTMALVLMLALLIFAVMKRRKKKAEEG